MPRRSPWDIRDQIPGRRSAGRNHRSETGRFCRGYRISSLLQQADGFCFQEVTCHFLGRSDLSLRDGAPRALAAPLDGDRLDQALVVDQAVAVSYVGPRVDDE